MKRALSFALILVMTLSLAACKTPHSAAIDPTEAPATEAPAATEAPTEAPTEEPTPEPTEEPTPEPTAVPEPTELAFEDCAELVISIPWGNGDLEAFIRPIRPGNDDDDWELPQHFNIIDGKIYIFDRYYPFGSGLLECDPETGEITRISPDIGENSFNRGEFALTDGKLIFSDCMFDLTTGKRIELEAIPGTPARRDGVLMMNVLDGKCFAYRAVNYYEGNEELEFLFTQATYKYDVFELDMENLAWVQKERIEMPRYVPHAEPPFSDYHTFFYGRGDVEIKGEDGGALFCFDRYMGTDDAGNHYIDSEETLAYKNDSGRYITSKTWRRIIKLSPDGTPISCVDVDYPDDYIFRFWGNYLVYKVDSEGTVWYMCETQSGVSIYKISL